MDNTLKTWSAIGLLVLSISSTLFLINALIEDGMVSGTDGGNLIAYSLELKGENIKAGDSTYAPLIPILLLGLSSLVSPIKAIFIVALVSIFVSLYAAFYSASVVSNKTLGILLVCIASTIGLSIEIISWGGYPQLLSNSLTLISITLIGRKANGLKLKDFFLICLLTWLALGIWIPGIIIWLLAYIVLCCLCLIQSKTLSNFKATIYKFARLLIVIVILCIPFLPFYISSFDIVDLKSWNHQQASLTNLTMVTDITFRFWPRLIVLVFGGLFILSLSGTIKAMYKKNKHECNGVVSVTLVSVFIFMTTNEIRSLNLFMIGAWMIIGYSTFSLIKELPRIRITQNNFSTYLAYARIACFLLVLSTQVYIFYKQVHLTTDYYRVITSEAKDAIFWLKNNNYHSQTAIETGNSYGLQYIWWLEGLSHTPTYSATDRNLFSFHTEREQTDIANKIINSNNPRKIAELSAQYNICLIFVDKDVYKKSGILTDAGFKLVYENSDFEIFSKNCKPN